MQLRNNLRDNECFLKKKEKKEIKIHLSKNQQSTAICTEPIIIYKF